MIYKDTKEAPPVVGPDEFELPQREPWEDVVQSQPQKFQKMQRSGTIRMVGPYNQSIRENANLRRSLAGATISPEGPDNSSPEDIQRLVQRRIEEPNGNVANAPPVDKMKLEILKMKHGFRQQFIINVVFFILTGRRLYFASDSESGRGYRAL